MATVQVEVGVRVVGSFQAGFFQRSEGGSVGQQLDFELALAGFGLRFFVGIAGSAEARYGSGLVNAGAVSSAGILAAPVSVDDERRSRLAQRQGQMG